MLVRLLAVTVAVSALAVAPVTSASADPKEDCNSVPLKFDKGFKSGGNAWRHKADLEVFDLCEEGAIDGTVWVKGGDVDSFTTTLQYQRHNDTSYRATGLTLTKGKTDKGWTAYKVTTDEDIYLHAGWLMGVRLRTTVTVGDDKVTKTTTCDRIHTEGDNAYLCHN